MSLKWNLKYQLQQILCPPTSPTKGGARIQFNHYFGLQNYLPTNVNVLVHAQKQPEYLEILTQLSMKVTVV